MKKDRFHQIFEISILLKGLQALTEFLGGVVLAFISTEGLKSLINRLTQTALIEDPNDTVALHLLEAAQGFSVSSQHFYAFYLISHGFVKMLLVIGLMRNKIWAYPASLFVLGLFIAYQLYRYSYTHSIALIVLTVFDLFVIALIWREYRLQLNRSGLR